MPRNICRLCLKQTVIKFSLVEKSTSEMVQSLLQLKIFARDKLSTICCYKCFLNLKLAYSIQQNMIKADKSLKSMTKFPKIKNQIIEISDCNVINKTVCFICHSIIKENSNHFQSHFTEEQSCDLCGKSFSNFEKYKTHNSLKHEGRVYICFKCDHTFRYKSLYALHMNNHKNTKAAINKLEDAFKCGDCEKLFKSRKLLKSHSAVHNPADYKCDICSKQFASKKLLKSHTNRHNAIRKQCPICNILTVKENYNKHLKTHNTNTLVCEICGSVLKNRESLRAHLSKTHSSKVYKCEKCDKSYKSKYMLDFHTRIEHVGKKTHICDLCGKGFFSGPYLRAHTERMHLKLKQHICKFCEKPFINRKAMRSHERQHTQETPYKCEVCGDAFKQNVSLRIHRKSKHNIVEPVTCACHICGKEFSSSFALKTHTYRLHP